jgi:hypothetical protein
MSLLE